MHTKILLVDDHPIFREGLRSLIDKGDTARVIGEAGDGAEAVRLAGELQPDLVIMDLTMPVMNGIDATREITARYPDIRVLALSMETSRFFVVEVLKAGATGYLLKDTAFPNFPMQSTSSRRAKPIFPARSPRCWSGSSCSASPRMQAVVYQNLTPREREILQLVADGKSIKEIAYELGISHKTVENQRQAIMQKLNLFSIAELTKYAVRHGLSPLTK